MKESEQILNKFITGDVSKDYNEESLETSTISLKTALEAIEIALNKPRRRLKVAPPRRRRGHIPLVDFDDTCQTMNIDGDEELKAVNAFEFMEAVKIILREKQFYKYIGGDRSFRVSPKRIKAVKDYFETSLWRKENK